MRFRIQGLDRATGEPREVMIEAADEAAAREAAFKDAIVVERVQEVAGRNTATGGEDKESALLRREYKSLTKAELSTIGALRVLAALLCILGIIMVVLGYDSGRSSRGYDPDSYFIFGQESKRFKTDNAVGATANAVEHIADEIGRSDPPDASAPVMGSVFFAAGIVALIPAELIRQRAVIRHYGEQLVAQRSHDHPT